MNAHQEFAVKAETHAGSTVTLRRCFPSRELAEQHPVKLSLWKRVWIEPIEKKPETAEATFPPTPWDWIASRTATANRTFHAYIVDANRRKIAAVWGRGEEKERIADAIIAAVNERFPPAEGKS